MTDRRSVRWAGWSMAAAGVCLLLTFLPLEQAPAAVATLPFLLALVLTTCKHTQLILNAPNSNTPISNPWNCCIMCWPFSL